MNVLARRLLGGGFVVAAMSVGLFVASTNADARSQVRYDGEFQTMEAGAQRGYDITGKARMWTGSDGTRVKIELEGLAEFVYGSHLHDGTCASGGGTHYLDDESGPDEPGNGIWMSSFEIGDGVAPLNGESEAEATGSATWMARTDAEAPATNALSVVVHDPDGARIACADLVRTSPKSGGNAFGR